MEVPKHGPRTSYETSYCRALVDMDGWTDGWQSCAQISPVFYRTSSPLRPLPCLVQNCHCNTNGQGKGTTDHLLPLSGLFNFPLPWIFTPGFANLRSTTLLTMMLSRPSASNSVCPFAWLSFKMESKRRKWGKKKAMKMISCSRCPGSRTLKWKLPIVFRAPQIGFVTPVRLLLVSWCSHLKFSNQV